MKEFADVLKIFVEKHLIPTVIAVAAAFALLYVLPKDYPIKVTLGQTFFLILSSCVIFLGIQLVIIIAKKIAKLPAKKRTKQATKVALEWEIKKNLEILWTFVDQLSADDINLLLDFLSTDNKPIERPANSFYSSNSLLGSNCIHSMIVEDPQQQVIHTEHHNVPGHTSIPLPIITYTEGKKQYILKDEIFQLLKYSKLNCGRISHFK